MYFYMCYCAQGAGYIAVLCVPARPGSRMHTFLHVPARREQDLDLFTCAGAPGSGIYTF